MKRDEWTNAMNVGWVAGICMSAGLKLPEGHRGAQLIRQAATRAISALEMGDRRRSRYWANRMVETIQKTVKQNKRRH